MGASSEDYGVQREREGIKEENNTRGHICDRSVHETAKY